MNKLMIIFLILSLSQVAFGFVKDPIYDDYEGYELIEVLIKDGKLDQAWQELEKKESQTKDPQRFVLLKGAFYSAKEEWSKVIMELQNYQGQNERVLVSSTLARAYFQLKDYKSCDFRFSQIPQAQLLSDTDAVTYSQCQFHNQQGQKAWNTLMLAQNRYHTFLIEREIISLKIKLGMQHEALTQALNWFAGNPGFPSQYLDIAEELHGSHNLEAALLVLEMGRVRYPLHLDINLTLSQLYFQKNMLLASEEGFARAASSDSKYFYHSAEINRQMGRTERSQYFNIFVKDNKEQLKQKIANYVDAGKFPHIASLESVIQRSELSHDDEIRYALAYALVRLGQVDEPLTYLSAITKPELIEKTTVLRKTLLDCQVKKAFCTL